MFQKIIDHFGGKKFSKVGERNFKGGKMVAFESRGKAVIAHYRARKGGLALVGFSPI